MLSASRVLQQCQLLNCAEGCHWTKIAVHLYVGVGQRSVPSESALSRGVLAEHRPGVVGAWAPAARRQIGAPEFRDNGRAPRAFDQSNGTCFAYRLFCFAARNTNSSIVPFTPSEAAHVIDVHPAPAFALRPA